MHRDIPGQQRGLSGELRSLGLGRQRGAQGQMKHQIDTIKGRIREMMGARGGGQKL